MGTDGGGKSVYTWGIYYYNKGASSVDTKIKNYNFIINSSIILGDFMVSFFNHVIYRVNNLGCRRVQGFRQLSKKIIPSCFLKVCENPAPSCTLIEWLFYSVFFLTIP